MTIINTDHRMVQLNRVASQFSVARTIVKFIKKNTQGWTVKNPNTIIMWCIAQDVRRSPQNLDLYRNIAL